MKVRDYIQFFVFITSCCLVHLAVAQTGSSKHMKPEDFPSISNYKGIPKNIREFDLYLNKIKRHNEITLSLKSDESISAMKKLMGLNDELYALLDSSDVLSLSEIDESFVPSFSDSVYAQRLKSIESIIPLTFNNSVKRWMVEYTSNRRKLVKKMLAKSEYYFPVFEEILAKYNIPEEIKHLAIVESALKPGAVSRSRATGLWQFMYGTGKIMGLRITYFIDERNDIYASTEAAAKYLAELYNTFDDWHLAIAAYNCGPGTMRRTLKKAGGNKTFWEIQHLLPKETRNYVPAFIAVNYYMNYAQEHNILPSELDTSKFFSLTSNDVDTVNINYNLSLSTVANTLEISEDQLAFYNPGLTQRMTPMSSISYALKLPAHKKAQFLSLKDSLIAVEKETVHLKGAFFDRDRLVYRVRSGDNLSVISDKFNCRIKDVMKWNGLRSSRIYPNQRLVVYKEIVPVQMQKTASASNSTNLSSQITIKGDQIVYHTISKGDTLWDIANKYSGISIHDIKKLNNIKDVRSLKPGTTIKIAAAG